MMGFGLIWVIVLVLVVAYLMGWRPENLNLGGQQERSDEKTPLEIVRERYARGEIERDEYERMRVELQR
ncbi:MAG: SHOCT domain-containing protein [Anaerolineae bacterium]|nr:SHOCT domain-containing protein [Anaerolineae bacterium]